MGPDLTQAIFDAVGLGFGQSGKSLQSSESFILADAYDPGDPQTGKPEIFPVVLHPSSGRRFSLYLRETASDTPPDPIAATELDTTSVVPVPVSDGEAVFTPTEDLWPDGAIRPQPVPAEPTIDGITEVPPAPPEPQQERPEPIQSFAHDPQPEVPESNVPPDFELKVQLHNERLQAGEPLPAPSPEADEDSDSDQTSH